MNAKYRALASIGAAAVLAVVLVPAASACGANPAFQGPLTPQQLSEDPMNPMAGASPESLLRDQQASANGRRPSIVGMWKISEHSGGQQIDFGYAQWHSDGTEFYNSGGFAPATQNYCLGVWAETEPRTYQVNHFALMYDMSGTYTGIINILETVRLSPGGTRYSGRFTINVYDTAGNQTKHVTGQVTGERVTLDTTP
jgi:opacity protein-like surface antigen